jgi:hypothetical protein
LRYFNEISKSPIIIITFLNMALLKRKKQQLNWGIGGTLDLIRNKAQDAIVTI